MQKWLGNGGSPSPTELSADRAELITISKMDFVSWVARHCFSHRRITDVRMAGVDEDVGAIDTTAVPEDACSVADLNDQIETALKTANDRFPNYVVGEVADISSYHFGTFFELRDINEEAKISCIAWSGVLASFDHDLEEGSAAVVRADVDFYTDRGDTQLSVSDYWPLGESDRAKELAELRTELEEEGLLADDRKQSIPEYPSCIGVVTSLTGSAREDFASAVNDRSPGVQVKLCGAVVQGDNAVPSLVSAIQRLEHDKTVDVLVVTRGGGSDTDLWCFNEEPVVRAIVDCSTPVVVAVGHEDDETLSEVVADKRAMTPTDAGITTTPNMAEVRERLGQLEVRVETAYQGVIEDELDTYDRRVESAFTALQQAVAAHIADLQRAADLEARIDQAYRTRISRDIERLDSRIETAYRDVEAEAKIEAGTAEARRLRIVVAVLLVTLLVGAALVVLFVL